MDEGQKATDEGQPSTMGECPTCVAKKFYLPTNRLGDLVMGGIKESLADLKRTTSSHLQDLASQVEDVDSQMNTLKEIREELTKRIKAAEQVLAGSAKLEKDAAAASEPLQVADPETIKQYTERPKTISQPVLALAKE